MKTNALRFSHNFAPPDGTIVEHKKYINKNGFVWYGKLGANVSDKVCKNLMESKSPRILLIHSGKTDRHWAYVDKVLKETPPVQDIPEYYREMADNFHTWFRVYKRLSVKLNAIKV